VSEEWEWKRLCIKNGSLWDVDANMQDHLKALAICNQCPVIEQCWAEATSKTRRKVLGAGMYAGRMWGDKGGPKTVWAWHDTHGSTGEKRALVNVGETRECKAEECDETFVITANAKHKLYHSPECSKNDRRRQAGRGLR
jgi:hypothetical protein